MYVTIGISTQWYESFVDVDLKSELQERDKHHYSDIIMGAMASQITSLTIVYLTVYSGVAQRKHQSSVSLAFERGINRWPAQMASNAENVSIWWRHHDDK